MKIKRIIRILCFMMGIVVMLAVSSMFVKPKANIYNEDAVKWKTESFKLEKENSLDVIFLGDSETYANFSPLQIWHEAGITSYVMGMSAQRLCDTYELLNRSIENQDIKLVLLETNCLYRDSSHYYDADDTVMNKAGDVFPILKYHSRWEDHAPGSASKINASEERKYKGFRLRFNILPYSGEEWMQVTDEIEEVSDDNMEYLNKIKKFCDDNEITLLLVSAPSPDCWNYARHNAVQTWADDNETDFLDLNLMCDELEIDWSKDTRDGGNHLNYYGAAKVSSYLSSYLMDKYELTDHRGDEYYSKWNDSYDKYFEIINKNISQAM